MDWMTGIQKAIDYIESNLLENLDSKDIAKRACISAFQFQRIFAILSEVTLGEYIRNRRLSLAAVDLQANKDKVVNIAMKYGYSTPESFSRAFERFHGVLPSGINNATTKMYSPLSIKVILEGGSVMDYKIEELKGFKVLGKVEKQIIGDVRIGAFWDKCRADGTFGVLEELSTSPDKEHIGFADGTSYDGKSYLYYIVTPYEGDVMPDGFLIKEFPDQTWIKFRCVSFGEGKNTSDEEIYKKIYSEYFPTSEYVPAEYQMEVYPRCDGEYPDEVSEVWIAAKKKDTIE